MAKQLTLLDLPHIPPAWAWEYIPGALGGKCFAEWRHSSGWTVHHCGHPTANYPYYIESPAGEMVLARNGRGFVHAEEARTTAEALAAGITLEEK